MIDLVWNFPLLEEQQVLWAQYLSRATAEYSAQSVEAQWPSFRTVELAMRERAAKWLGLPTERVWMTSGGHHGTLNALLASGLAGTRVAMEGASYPGFLDQCRMTKTAIDACAIDDDGLIPESLREVCAAAKAEGRPVRGFFTMPTVQNPIGFVTPLARRIEIVEIAREFDLTIIEDDAYGCLEADPPANYAELAPERSFYVRTLAKSFAPGARTGLLVAPESATAGLVMSLKCTATGTDVPQNMAMLAMMEDGTLSRLMAEKRAEGEVRNREARALLGGVAAPGAVAAWHLWVPLAESVDQHELERAINDAGAIVTAGHWCAAGPGYGHGIRVALGGEVQRERTMEGVALVAEVLRRF
jgi:DNA-binding transcriptional MocR family regulator